MCRRLFHFFNQPEHHDHPVGSAHLDVGGGDGVLLPLLRCLHFIPLPLSMQEAADPGH